MTHSSHPDHQDVIEARDYEFALHSLISDAKDRCAELEADAPDFHAKFSTRFYYLTNLENYRRHYFGIEEWDDEAKISAAEALVRERMEDRR